MRKIDLVKLTMSNLDLKFRKINWFYAVLYLKYSKPQNSSFTSYYYHNTTISFLCCTNAQYKTFLYNILI